jgi:hypothetical protein
MNQSQTNLYDYSCSISNLTPTRLEKRKNGLDFSKRECIKHKYHETKDAKKNRLKLIKEGNL